MVLISSDLLKNSSCFVHLTKLTLRAVTLSPPYLLHLLVTSLPHLQHLSLSEEVEEDETPYDPHNDDENDDDNALLALFHPNNHPADAHLLCPLISFTCMHSRYFPEPTLRIFLQRFLSSLSHCHVHKVGMTKAQFRALQREYRFRVAISASMWINVLLFHIAEQ